MNIYFFRRYLYTFDRRRIFLFSAAALIAVCLLWPVRWTISLPGEVRYAKEDRLIAHENGYILRSPPEGSHFFKTGETIFLLEDPFLRFARERVEYMLHFDRLLFEQQRSGKSTLGDSLLTGRKIESDLHAAGELERKIADGRKAAADNVIFIPAREHISKGYFVRSGLYLGKLCSGKKIVRAYANDQQIRDLKCGMAVNLLLRDCLTGISGKISKIHHIPVYLTESPALQYYGGEIPVDANFDGAGEVRSFEPVYAVDIMPDKPLHCQTGRFIRAEVHQRQMPAAKIWRLVISAFKRELF
ncbi:MAG: hypothetical protein IKA32_09020 [Lentisphaeria bacterium]|nr:hypothetical protein [Lentisphaeria bacterium]